MENKMLNQETIKARIQIIELLKSATAEARNLNTQLDNMHQLLINNDQNKLAA